MKHRFSNLDVLISNRFRKTKDIRDALDKRSKQLDRFKKAAGRGGGSSPREASPRFIKGIHRGNFYRIKLPPAIRNRKSIPDMPRLPNTNPQSTPKTLTSAPPTPSQTTKSLAANHATYSRREWYEEFAHLLWEWWKTNWPVLVFNFGSVCSLIGFTRSDVLELRVLSVTGSACGVLYNLYQTPLRVPPIAWSLTFGAVNAWKIYEIFLERRGVVHLTHEQESIYIKHFLPHGITPKQFEAIHSKAERLTIPKGKPLIRKGEELEHVWLVVHGSTTAHMLGRRLTAASTRDDAHETNEGGASGAWIGEITFLECLWYKEQSKNKSPPSSSTADSSATATSTPTTKVQPPLPPPSLVLPHTAKRITPAPIGLAVPIPALQQKEQAALSSPHVARNTTIAGSDTKDAKLTATTTTTTSSSSTTATSITRKSSETDKDATRDPTPNGTDPNDEPLTKPVKPSDQGPQKPKTNISMYSITAKEDCEVLRWTHDDMDALMGRSADLRNALTRAMTAAIVGKVINFTVSRSTGQRSWATFMSAFQGNNDKDKQQKEQQQSANEKLPVYPIKTFDP